MPGASGWPVSLPASSGGCTSARPSTRSISLARQAAGTQQHRRLEASDNGGFDADLDRAAVDDQIDPPGEVALHMGRRGRRDMARQIRRRRHHRPAEGAQDLPRHADAPEPGSRRYRARRWRDRPPRSRWSWAAPASAAPARTPRPARSPGASKRADPPGGLEIADMGDQRIEGGPALGLIEPRDRRGVGGVGAEAIDGLGREPDQAAFGQAARRGGHGGLAGGQNLAFSGPHSRELASSIRLLAVCETQGYKPRSCRSVAQPGRALRSGRRGRRFKSCHSDQYIDTPAFS